MRLYNFILGSIFLCNLKLFCYSERQHEHVYNIPNGSENTHLRFDSQNVQKGIDSYTLNRFEKFLSVPVMYPLDICLFDVEGMIFTASLHHDQQKTKNKLFSIFSVMLDRFKLLYHIEVPHAISMDCLSMDNRAFIALVYNITEKTQYVNNGSPIFEVYQNNTKIVQYISTPYQKSIFLRKHGDELFLLQVYESSSGDSSDICLIYHWSGYHFEVLDKIICQNVKQIELFVIESEIFFASGYYSAEKYEIGNTETQTFIYKFNVHKRKFTFYQKIPSFRVADIKYFYIDINELERDHFLAIADMTELDSNHSEVGERRPTIYKFTNGDFTPFQEIFFSSIYRILPVQSGLGKFILLVVCENQEVQILEFDGHSFRKSVVQFTEGSFGKGVINMRTFLHENEMLIVIANKNMIVNDTNIFIPKYKRDSLAQDMRQKLLEWSKKVYEKLSAFNTASLERRIQKLAKSKGTILPDTKQNILNVANIKLAITKLFRYEKLKMTRNYWKSLYSSMHLMNDAGEKLKELDQKTKYLSTLLAENDVDYIGSIENLQRGDPVESISFDKLTVRKKITADNINNQTNRHLKFENISASKILTKTYPQVQDLNNPQNRRIENDFASLNKTDNINGKYFSSIKIKQLTIDKNINNINLDLLNKKMLKTVGNQELTTELNLKKFKVQRLQCNGLINNNTLSKIVLTKGRNIIVNQDIAFAKPLTVNKLNINDRLNSIHVLQGELEILKRKSKRLQILSGPVTFESVNLLQPIVLQGKIKSKSLEKMNPVSTINEDKIFHGDVIISGPVTIDKILSSSNIFDSSKNGNLLKVLKLGLRKSSDMINGSYHFEHTIRTGDVASKLINNFDSQKFIKINKDELQEIDGLMIFEGDLQINAGFCESKIINGIDINNLAKTVLRKTGNQNVTGKIHFRKIKTPKIFGQNSTRIGDALLSSLLTSSTVQYFENGILVKDTLADFVHVNNLIVDGQVFGSDLESLVKDTVSKIDTGKNIMGRKTFRGNLSAGQIYVKKNLNSIQGTSLEEIISHLNVDIKLKGPINFSSDVFVQNMNFTSYMNQVSSIDFGKNWLLMEGNQEFSAPQKFDTLNFEDDLILSTLNGYLFDNLLQKTIWTNKNEILENVKFNNLACEDSLKTFNNKINEINFTDELVLSESKIPQKLNGLIKCQDNIYIRNNIKQLNKINSLDINGMKKLLSDRVDNIAIRVDDAVFASQPRFININNKNVEDLLSLVWLKNKDTILNERIYLKDARFKSDMNFKNTINNVDIKYGANNCFSLSQSQNITTNIFFKNEVLFENILKGPKLQVDGKICDTNSNLTMNIDEFVTNTLSNMYEQEITGKWYFKEIYLLGDSYNITINNLNFRNDVASYTVPINNITATKYIESASTVNLIYKKNSHINDVNLKEWFEKAVLVYGNFTIQGTCTLNIPIVHNNIEVLGTVNNNKFTEDNILLRLTDQTIDGNLYITTKYPEENRLLSLAFANLYINKFNGIKMNSFLDCLPENVNNLPTITNLNFKHPLKVTNYNGKNHLFGYKSQDLIKLYNSSNVISNTTSNFQWLQKFSNDVWLTYWEKPSVFDHFEFLQNIPIGFSIILQLKFSSKPLLTVLDSNDYIQFYEWNYHQKQFSLSEDFAWKLIPDNIVIDVIKVPLTNTEDILVVQTFSATTSIYDYHFFTGSAIGLHRIFKISDSIKQLIRYIQMDGEQCIAIYSDHSSLINVNCFSVKDHETVELINKGHLQVPIFVEMKQIGKELLLMTPSQNLQIWSLDLDKTTPQQIITSLNATSTSYTSNQNFHYLATLTIANKMGVGLIEIFRSKTNSNFKHFQTIKVFSPIDCKLSTSDYSNELFLYIISGNKSTRLLIYIFNGISGFKKFASIALKSKVDSIYDFIFEGDYFIIGSSKEATYILKVFP